MKQRHAFLIPGVGASGCQLDSPLRPGQGLTAAALLGEALRTWSSGTLVKNEVLTTEGPYALCRNPLYVGNFLIGFGGALFGHGTLTATMNRAPRAQAGLALGAWGAVQATAVGLGMAMSGAIRDLVDAALGVE